MGVLLVCAVVALTLYVGAGVLAVRLEHLLVLHWPRRPLVVLEEVGAGRYHRLPLLQVPQAVGRFVARAARAGAAELQLWVARTLRTARAALPRPLRARG